MIGYRSARKSLSLRGIPFFANHKRERPFVLRRDHTFGIISWAAAAKIHYVNAGGSQLQTIWLLSASCGNARYKFYYQVI